MRAGVWPARTLALAALTGLFFVAAWPASAQEADVPGAGDATLGERSYPIDPLTAPRPSLKAVRTDEPIVIDGRLDEPAWALADVAADFVQNQPQPGHAASERTEVRVLYDSESLYISAVCHDSEMDKVLIPGLPSTPSTTNATPSSSSATRGAPSATSRPSTTAGRSSWRGRGSGTPRPR
jgi:hypothetical protein